MSTTQELIAGFTQQLSARREALAADLLRLDEEHATKRRGLQDELVQIDAALNPKKSNAKPSGKRYTMSEQGKANIRAAMEARRARLAAAVGGSATETVSVPSAGTEEQSDVVQEAATAIERTSSKKGRRHGAAA